MDWLANLGSSTSVLPATVLIVEDDRSFARALSSFLSDQGYRVLTANSGQAAIDAARTQDFDLAILDVYLPDILGSDLIRDLRTCRPQASFVSISADDSAANARACRNAGAQAFLPKPVGPQVLLTTIERVLDIDRPS
jgi:DNA-binding response OmpR family regulator